MKGKDLDGYTQSEIPQEVLKSVSSEIRSKENTKKILKHMLFFKSVRSSSHRAR